MAVLGPRSEGVRQAKTLPIPPAHSDGANRPPVEFCGAWVEMTMIAFASQPLGTDRTLRDIVDSKACRAMLDDLTPFRP